MTGDKGTTSEVCYLFVSFCGCLVVSEKTVKSGENFSCVEAFFPAGLFPP